jgi:hypothetical protein
MKNEPRRMGIPRGSFVPINRSPASRHQCETAVGVPASLVLLLPIW